MLPIFLTVYEIFEENIFLIILQRVKVLKNEKSIVLTPCGDQSAISPFSMNKLTSKQVMRISRYQMWILFDLFNSNFSELTS